MCKVLIADENDVLRTAIRKSLERESNIAIVGEASTFAQVLQMVDEFKPDVLLLDLQLAEKHELIPVSIRAQLVPVRLIAISFANDAASEAIAESYGAETLLDKMNLFTEMLPAILHCHPELTLRRKSAGPGSDCFSKTQAGGDR